MIPAYLEKVNGRNSYSALGKAYGEFIATVGRRRRCLLVTGDIELLLADCLPRMTYGLHNQFVIHKFITHHVGSSSKANGPLSVLGICCCNHPQ
jgi:hypothetical protein